MPDDNAPLASQLLGGVMHSTAMIQAVIYTLVSQGIIPPKVFEHTLDQALLQWEQIAAHPDHDFPEATANARARMEAFLMQFRAHTAPKNPGAPS